VWGIFGSFKNREQDGHQDGGGTKINANKDGANIMDSSWLSLSSVDFVFDSSLGSGAAALDVANIRVMVPIPAAAWLFASGIGLLGWIRRRQSPC
jgi:hypothetical protein